MRADIRASEVARREELTPEWVRLEDRLEIAIAALGAAILLRKDQGQLVSQAFLLSLPEYILVIVLLESELDHYADFVESNMELDAELFSDLGIEIAGEALELIDLELPDIEIEPPEIDAGWRRALATAIAIGISAAIFKINSVTFDDPSGFVAEIMDSIEQGFDRFLGVLRDYQTQATRDAMEEVYDEFDFVAFQRFSAFTPTTCMACILLDGTIYLTIAEFRDHHNGFCFILPITDMDNLPLEIFGEELFLTFSTNEQRALMGPRYYKAWRNGEFALEDLIAFTDDERPVPERLRRLVA